MLAIVKKALRITKDAFDDELMLLINDCIEEMTGLGVLVNFYGQNYIIDIDREYLATIYGQKIYVQDEDHPLPDGVEIPDSPQILTAIIAYCKWKFGDNENADRWENIYHEKLAQLKTMTGFTDWGGSNG